MLVTIAIPTYDRVDRLRRAVESVQNQTYRQLEILVSDNASTDGTASLCKEFARSDPRVRYIRRSKNLGAADNFRCSLEEATGEVFMWLADDDWLDPGYIEACVQAFHAHPSVAMVQGVVRYHERARTWDEPHDALDQPDARVRVARYFDTVIYNGLFYSVTRTEFLQSVPWRDHLGSDWLFVARLLWLTPCHRFSGACLHRSADGTSADMPALARRYGLSPTSSRYWHVWVALDASSRLAWRDPAWQDLPARQRCALGWHVLKTIVRRMSWPMSRSEVRSTIVRRLPPQVRRWVKERERRRP